MLSQNGLVTNSFFKNDYLIILKLFVNDKQKGMN